MENLTPKNIRKLYIFIISAIFIIFIALPLILFYEFKGSEVSNIKIFTAGLFLFSILLFILRNFLVNLYYKIKLHFINKYYENNWPMVPDYRKIFPGDWKTQLKEMYKSILTVGSIEFIILSAYLLIRVYLF